jgi:hypothetical protein
MRLTGASNVNAESNSNFRSLALSLLALILFSACHTARNDVPQPTGPPDDIVEARRNVTASLNAVQSMLDVLDNLSIVSGSWPPDLVSQFTIALPRLEADSFKLRAHARAMHSRGDAYFSQWQLHLEQSRDPEVRTQAGEHHQALQDSFGRIRQAAERGSEAFKSFLADLHTLRRALENETSGSASDSTKALARKAREEGLNVRSELETIRRELGTAASELKARQG